MSFTKEGEILKFEIQVFGQAFGSTIAYFESSGSTLVESVKTRGCTRRSEERLVTKIVYRGSS